MKAQQKKLELLDVIQSIQSKTEGSETWSYTILGDKFPENEEQYYSTVFFSFGTKPTWDQVQAELPLVQQQFENEKYKYSRINEYPSLEDQLDMIFHGGVDEWKAKIQEIKDKYPKP